MISAKADELRLEFHGKLLRTRIFWVVFRRDQTISPPSLLGLSL
jgi:hypothetical protein